jgi:hypothetical protein
MPPACRWRQFVSLKKESTMKNLVSPGRPGAEELSSDETPLALRLGSVNLARAAAAIEKSLPKPQRQPMLSETLSQQDRKAEFERLANHVGDNLARVALAMRLPK